MPHDLPPLAKLFALWKQTPDDARPAILDELHRLAAADRPDRSKLPLWAELAQDHADAMTRKAVEAQEAAAKAAAGLPITGDPLRAVRVAFDAHPSVPKPRGDAPALRLALARLVKARSDHDAAVGAYAMAETINGVGSPEADALDAKIDAAGEALTAAETEAGRAPATNLPDLLAKVAAVLDEAMYPDTVTALRADLARFTDPEGDPVVELGARWRMLEERIEALFARPDADEGPIENPELVEAIEAQNALTDRLAAMVPTTAEGLAVMADLAWGEHGPTCAPGTDGWARELDNPATRILARLRHGAYVLAGRDDRWWRTRRSHSA